MMSWKTLLAKVFGNITSVPRAESPQIDGAQLMLPYQVAEAPRLLLHVLAKSSMLDDNIKTFIANWLMGYDDYLRTFLASSYGAHALPAADAITSQVHSNMMEAFTEQYELSMAESFAKWDQELAAEDDASSA